MRSLILVLLLICSAAFAQVNEEVSLNDYGQYFIRIHNYTNSYYSCYYKDEANYFTFILAPYTSSGWQPIYGIYEWNCK